MVLVKMSSCCISELMVDCWSETPEQRPDFNTIRNRLKRLRMGMKSNIMDQMIDMLEKYSNNLEVCGLSYVSFSC